MGGRVERNLEVAVPPPIHHRLGRTEGLVMAWGLDDLRWLNAAANISRSQPLAP